MRDNCPDCGHLYDLWTYYVYLCTYYIPVGIVNGMIEKKKQRETKATELAQEVLMRTLLFYSKRIKKAGLRLSLFF